MENRDLARCKQKTGTVRTADTGLHLGARLSEVGNLDFRARGEAKKPWKTHREVKPMAHYAVTIVPDSATHGLLSSLFSILSDALTCQARAKAARAPSCMEPKNPDPQLIATASKLRLAQL